MRKFLCGILSVVLILSLAACGAKTDTPDTTQKTDESKNALTQVAYESEDYCINVPDGWTLESTVDENNELVSINTWTTEDMPFTNLKVVKYAQPAAVEELKEKLAGYETLTNITGDVMGNREEPMSFVNQETGAHMYLFFEVSADATYIVSYEISSEFENDTTLEEQLTEMALSFAVN